VENQGGAAPKFTWWPAARTQLRSTGGAVILIVDNFQLRAMATLPQTYTVTGNSAAMPPAVALVNFFAA
jgi:hypothetical protein